MKSTSQSVVEPGGAPTAEDTRRNIVGLDQAALSRELSALGIPKGELRMRTAQIWHWVYHRGATSFADMSTIAKTTQAQLTEHFRIDRPKIVERLISEDGTRKYLLRFDDGTEAETVFIPDAERGTLCVSSQVGCTLNCTFCHTGTQRWVRNLTAGEIVGQLMLARDDLGEWPSSRQPRRLSSVVLMGMGEPLYNFDNVKTAIGIMTDGEGIQISRRRITLSTAGVVPELRRAGDEIGVNLAVSLHAVTDEIRDRLVPLNRKYPIAELLEACQSYPGAGNARRITFEYALLKGVNDSDQDAKRLVALIHRYKLPAKVNLIPFNPWPGAPYECSDWDRIQAFSKIIYKSGISAPIRMPRGRDIMAACGQLKSDSVRTRASGSGPKAKVQVTEPG